MMWNWRNGLQELWLTWDLSKKFDNFILLHTASYHTLKKGNAQEATVTLTFDLQNVINLSLTQGKIKGRQKN